ncbi:hypothetical protein Hdeb2414_s0032g00712101 [Helianthus debilis subsp. tardiflorus]
MEASLNVTEIVDANDLPKELGSCPEKYNIADKTHATKQKTSVSGKRSEKRNGKLSKNKCDIFSIKAGLSSFRSSAGGNSVLGIYGSKHDICDFAKHVDEVSLNELLDGSYKCPDSIKVKEQSTEGLTEVFCYRLEKLARFFTTKSLLKPQQTHLLVTSGGSLPTFPWSHVSGGHFKVNPDAVKSTPSKSMCQGRWIKMGKLIMSLGDATTYLADFQSLTYNPSLVPLGSQQPGPTENDKSLLLSTFDRGVLSAAQTLCNIAAVFRKQGQYGPASWQKKSSQKPIRASKLTSDERPLTPTKGRTIGHLLHLSQSDLHHLQTNRSRMHPWKQNAVKVAAAR